MSIHITSTHWGRDLCPQVFNHCPAFCVSDKNYIWGLLAFTEFGMLIWCPGIVRVFLFSWWLFLWGFPGLSLLSALAFRGVLLVSCWPFSSPMGVHSWGLEEWHQALPPSKICLRVTLRPKQLPTNSSGHWSWQRESSLGDAGSREGDRREQGGCVGSATA